MNQHLANEDGSQQPVLVCQAIYLVQGNGTCYSCHKDTRLFAVMALPPFSFEGGQDDAMDEDGSMLREIVELPSSVATSIAKVAGVRFRLDHSRTAGARYWMNHCEHCDAKQGDFFVHGPNGPFWPNDSTEMDAIVATKLEGNFRFAEANAAYSGAMADWRDRRHGVVRPPPPPPKPRKPRAKKLAQ